MTDEGFQGDPMSEVEMTSALRNLAIGVKAMYDQYIADGFTPTDALGFVRAWIHGTAGGKLQ